MPFQKVSFGLIVSVSLRSLLFLFFYLSWKIHISLSLYIYRKIQERLDNKCITVWPSPGKNDLKRSTQLSYLWVPWVQLCVRRTGFELWVVLENLEYFCMRMRLELDSLGSTAPLTSWKQKILSHTMRLFYLNSSNCCRTHQVGDTFCYTHFETSFHLGTEPLVIYAQKHHIKNTLDYSTCIGKEKKGVPATNMLLKLQVMLVWCKKRKKVYWKREMLVAQYVLLMLHTKICRLFKLHVC